MAFVFLLFFPPRTSRPIIERFLIVLDTFAAVGGILLAFRVEDGSRRERGGLMTEGIRFRLIVEGRIGVRVAGRDRGGVEGTDGADGAGSRSQVEMSSQVVNKGSSGKV